MDPSATTSKCAAAAATIPRGKNHLIAQIPLENQAHATDLGAYLIGDSLALLASERFGHLEGKVDLILTSPPFPLNRKKSYGNLQGEKYLEWFIQMAPIFNRLLSAEGSLVIELGNAWEPGRPVQSLLHLQALMSLVQHEEAEFRLIQQFINYNPSRLPSPAQWVTVQRCRVVDSFTHVWWLAKTDFPKADNTKVLRPYSKSMRKLLDRGSYNSGRRPSEHSLSSEGFLKDQGGSIAHNVMECEPIDPSRPYRPPNVFSLANSMSTDAYHRACRERGLKPHPARMHPGLAAFFISFLTDPGDLVIDPFAGSNTTGFLAETMGRHWLAFDVNQEYADHSIVRFECKESV